MALSFTEKVSTRIGRRKFKVYEVTHDGSATTVDASSLGLNYIDYALVNSKTALSSVADLARLSTVTGTNVLLGAALSADTVDIIQVWGY